MLAHLLPLQFAVALDELRHQLFGGDLLEVLLAVSREVAVSGRERGSLCEILVGGAIQPEPTVQLLLGHAGVDRPNLHTSLQFYAEGSRSEERRVGGGGSS